MALSFINPETGTATGSTVLGRAVLGAAVSVVNPKLSEEISLQSNWRKTYQSLFARVAKAEFATKHSALEVANYGLASFEQRIATSSGENLLELIRTSWRNNKGNVLTVKIHGSGVPQIPGIDELHLKQMVANHSAEKGIIDAVQGLSGHAFNADLLVALAGGAEYSPTRLWLDWGGDVAIVARSRKELWSELITRARKSSGTLFVPVLAKKLTKDVNSLSDDELASLAGLDLVEDYEAITGWIAELARTDSRRIVLGNYAYAPGAKHIEVQAVQHCIARTITEALPKSRVVLSWLATPTDSHVVSVEFANDIATRFTKRSRFTKIRDFVFSAREHKPETFNSEAGIKYALIDPTSSMQGSSYALAKRVQRWMAYQQVAAGRVVSYQVAPPATTDSVLSHRILRATYRGAPHFGLFPYETHKAVRISALLLIAQLQAPINQGFEQVYSQLAVHGGLWRSLYNPADLWRVTTIRGIWGYFSKH
ncbi:MAG: hypothetical protein WCG32_02425 [Actinomycetes bacterium]